MPAAASSVAPAGGGKQNQHSSHKGTAQCGGVHPGAWGHVVTEGVVPPRTGSATCLHSCHRHRGSQHRPRRPCGALLPAPCPCRADGGAWAPSRLRGPPSCVGPVAERRLHTWCPPVRLSPSLLFGFRGAQGLGWPRKYRLHVSQGRLQALRAEGTPRVGRRQTRPGSWPHSPECAAQPFGRRPPPPH